jgi:hypothetical protein
MMRTSVMEMSKSSMAKNAGCQIGSANCERRKRSKMPVKTELREQKAQREIPDLVPMS